MSKPSQAAVLIERSKRDVAKVQLLVGFTVLCHLMTSTTMMVMAFFRSEVFGTSFSTTLVLCAFGGLIAVLWASVAAFEVWSAPPVVNHRSLPKWEWHNRQFGLAVGVVFLDTICVLPACFLFVLHARGEDAFIILKTLKASDVAVVVLLLVVALLLGLVQIGSIIHISRHLHKHQDALEAQSSVVLPFTSKCLVGAKMVLDGCFLIILFVVAVQSGGNSGPILCVIPAAATIGVFLLFLFQLVKGLNAEAFLTRWRQACVLQCFLTYGEFWVSFIVYLLRRKYEIDFFASVNDMSDSRRALVGVALATMLLSIGNYLCLLFYHARCMAALDEMGSFSHLEGVDTAPNLFAGSRVTRVTAVEMTHMG